MKRATSRRCLLMTLMVCACMRITHAQSCEPHWSDQFAAADLDHIVHALATFDDGQGGGPAVYAGGNFSTGGDVALNHIGKLENNIWTPLGTGTNGRVRALMGFDDESDEGRMLIVGGNFTTAGTIPANYIAEWDGQVWAALGGGVNHWVLAIESFDDDQGDGPALYAGGLFTAAGGRPVSYVAKWDGQRWSPLGDGVNDLVSAMTVFDDGAGDGPALYVAGGFTEAGEVEANFIAKWDGERWSAVGAGMDNKVRALAVFDDGSGPALYAGGLFTIAGGVPANRIAKWDGVSWSSVGSGTDGLIEALGVYDDRSGEGPALYAGGIFWEAGGVEARNIARWDGSTWSMLDTGVDGLVSSLTVADDGSGDGPKLFVGGFFDSAGDLAAHHFAKWNGTAWSTAGNGMAGGSIPTTKVATFQAFDDGLGDGVALYAGGAFTSAGGVGSRWIAKWDGAHWSPVGTEIDDGEGAIFALAVFEGSVKDGPTLYAGGGFGIIGGVTAKSIAKWDGATWSPLGYVYHGPRPEGSGVNGSVYSLAVFDDGTGEQLYVGGVFDEAEERAADNIARWDGSRWSPVGDGVQGDGPYRVQALAVFDDASGARPALYAAGHFLTAGDVEVRHIARWNGSTWAAVGSGFDIEELATIFALAVFDDGRGPALYAGGNFHAAGEVVFNGLAKWDGSTWSPVGGGVALDGYGNGVVVTLTPLANPHLPDSVLFVGGWFDGAGRTPANSIAAWNGTNWSQLANGVGGDDPIVWSSIVYDDGSDNGPALFLGGEFTSADDLSSQRVAKWILCETTIPGDLDGDGVVGAADLAILLASWGPCGDCNDCPADLDGNCTVSVSDLLILLANWQ